MRDPDSNTHVSIGERRHGHRVDLPLDGRLRMRLGRAITNSLVNPSRSNPTLRRTIVAVGSALRAQGFTEEGIRARLALLIQSIALDRGLNAGSIVSGRPRWQELSDRVGEWIANDADGQ